MTDDFDAFVRDRLAAEGNNWAPGRTMESTRDELAGRVRAAATSAPEAVIGAMAIVVLTFALVHLNSAATGSQLDANPSAPDHGAGPTAPGPGPGEQLARAVGDAPRDGPRPGGDTRPGRAPGGTAPAGAGDRPGPPSLHHPAHPAEGTVAGPAPPTGSGVAPTLPPPVTEPGSTGPPPHHRRPR